MGVALTALRGPEGRDHTPTRTGTTGQNAHASRHDGAVWQHDPRSRQNDGPEQTEAPRDGRCGGALPQRPRGTGQNMRQMARGPEGRAL